MKTLKYIALAALTCSLAACEQEDFTPSVQGDADAAVASLLAGTLEASDAPNCSHHDEHHGADHVCGEHGCGEGHDCHCH